MTVQLAGAQFVLTAQPSSAYNGISFKALCQSAAAMQVQIRWKNWKAGKKEGCTII